MMSSRTSERWILGAALFVLISQFLLLQSGPVRAAVAPDVLLQPTPLVLKDGRIANVSIHVLPFDTGNGELPDQIESQLAEITAALATDCFLTAQVIGHVSSREVAENETLAAHRLARARADAVQAALIGSGLPAKAIASVWDWQFLVREPRATLWMFRLIQGEDCEGLPLDGSAAPLIASDEAPAQAAPGRASTAEAAPQPAQDVAQAPQAVAPPAASPAQRAVAAPPAVPPAKRAPELAGMVGSAVAAEPPAQAESAPAAAAASQAREGAAVASEARDRSQAGPARTEAARNAAVPPPAATQAADQPAAVAAGPAPEAVPVLTRPLPALSPAPPARPERSGETAVAAVEPQPAAATAKAQRTAAVAPQSGAAPQHPERQGKVEWGQDNVVITFATNSSYFPPGTTRRLRTLLGNMAQDGRYRVQLEVGVSGSDTVVGAKTPEEARRYNRWLAERRLDRVREWLGENAAGRQIEIEPAFQPDDNSRRVVVRVAPVS